MKKEQIIDHAIESIKNNLIKAGHFPLVIVSVPITEINGDRFSLAASPVGCNFSEAMPIKAQVDCMQDIVNHEKNRIKTAN